jgi:hypothetical protein
MEKNMVKLLHVHFVKKVKNHLYIHTPYFSQIKPEKILLKDVEEYPITLSVYHLVYVIVGV